MEIVAIILVAALFLALGFVVGSTTARSIALVNIETIKSEAHYSGYQLGLGLAHGVSEYALNMGIKIGQSEANHLAQATVAKPKADNKTLN